MDTLWNKKSVLIVGVSEFQERFSLVELSGHLNVSSLLRCPLIRSVHKAGFIVKSSPLPVRLKNRAKMAEAPKQQPGM